MTGLVHYRNIGRKFILSPCFASPLLTWDASKHKFLYAGPSQQSVLQMVANGDMDASPAFMRVNQNESDTWFQHNEPPVLGIADMFDQDQDIAM